MNFKGLHGVISQKTQLFLTTAVRTSNPTSLAFILMKYNETAIERTWLMKT
jgi:hypothetical protein